MFWKKVLANTFSLLVVMQIYPGIYSANLLITIVAAFVLGVLNTFIKPILLILTLPLNILTLGLLTFIINGFILYFTAGLVVGFRIAGFGAAVVGGLLFSLVNMLVNSMIREA
jgi:putative membrane protein